MEVCSDLDVYASKKPRWQRDVIADKIVNIKDIIKTTNNTTAAAKQTGVPRSTLQYWLAREGKTGLSPAVERFFESPDGSAFLHQLVISAQFTMTKLGPCGLEIFSEFMQRSQLSQFVGSSHGATHRFSVAMENAMLQYEGEEKPRLAAQMSTKQITTCQDETFHPDICLVAMEPVSNFILVEQYRDKRDAASWSASMQEGLNGLSVEIIQCTSDEGTGLLKYVEKTLGAQHSPDLFHVQQELTRATSAPIAAKVKQAEKIYEESSKKLEQLEKKQKKDPEYYNRPYSAVDGQVIDAEMKKDAALRDLNEIKQYQTDAKEAKKALGDTYHPYDINTGMPQTAQVISEKLEHHFVKIKTAAIETNLSDNSMSRLEKAHRVFKDMIGTMAFFWAFVKQTIVALGLSPEIEAMMQDVLIPGFYLQIAAKKARNAKERRRIEKLAQELLAKLKILDLWGQLDKSTRNKLETTAKKCAQMFQRSSSCVEGRNGYLSLRHHSSHRLGSRKLRTLTIIHNYFLRRPDGTTAAERFFEEKPRDLFQYLLDNVALPARPAKTRKLAMAA